MICTIERRAREREENVTASVAKRSVRVRAYALANYYMYVSLVYLFIHLLLLCGRHTHANGEKRRGGVLLFADETTNAIAMVAFDN